MSENEFERAVEALSGAGRVTVLSGAGISAESGVPTFRSAGGLWENHRLEDVATPQALRRNPDLVWEFYEMRRMNMESVEPNPGHFAIAQMQELFEEFTTITQNIDGLHQRAGSAIVHEVHGSLWKAHCLEQCGETEDPFPYPARELPPPCRCGSILRPSVVLFGENLPEDVLASATNAAVRSDVALVVGTSSLVWPAAGIPLIASEHGATVIEVNPEPTDLTDRFHISLRALAGELLPRLLGAIREVRA